MTDDHDAPAAPLPFAGGPRHSRGLRLVAASVAVYAALALLGRPSPAGEIFPFFSWNLFSSVPGERVRAAVHLTRVGGEELDPPLPLMGSGLGRGQPVVAAELADDLLLALREDPDDAERLRSRLAGNHLPEGADWTLVLERFEPLRRWRDGRYAVTEVARFPAGGGTGVEPAALDLPAGSVRIAGRQLDLGRADGRVERVEHRDGAWRVSGWAGDVAGGRLPDRLVVFRGGRAAATGGVGITRRDVGRATGVGALSRSGFAFFVPGDPGAPPDDLRVVAEFDDAAGIVEGS